MLIEHMALNVPDPAEMADWYAQLGFQVVRAAETPVPVRFIRQTRTGFTLELYRNADSALDLLASLTPVALHLAFATTDPSSQRDALVELGAVVEKDFHTTPEGDSIVMLRDPWGLPIQLVRRAGGQL